MKITSDKLCSGNCPLNFFAMSSLRFVGTLGATAYKLLSDSGNIAIESPQ